MIFGRLMRNKEDKDDVDRNVVDRLEVDRFLEAGKKSERSCQIGDAGVWNCNPVAYAGRTKFFSSVERFQD